MKISVKQGRIMAFMVAMVLIVGIFIIGKILGYGSASNRYIMEFEGDECEMGDCFETGDLSGNDVSGAQVDASGAGVQGFVVEAAGHKKSADRTTSPSTAANREEKFTCGNPKTLSAPKESSNTVMPYDADSLYSPIN